MEDLKYDTFVFHEGGLEKKSPYYSFRLVPKDPWEAVKSTMTQKPKSKCIHFAENVLVKAKKEEKKK